MQKWEYTYFQTEHHVEGFYYTAASKERVVFVTEDRAQIQDINSYLDKLGAEGWEMLAVNVKFATPNFESRITIYHFKRPIE